MSTTADILRKLHRLHRQLADLQDRLERGPIAIRARESNVKRLETVVAETRDKTQHARMSADEKQLQLKSGENKILDLRTKLNTANSNREYQALLEQIAADEMTNSVLEDEILEALEKIEQLQIAIGEAEKQLEDGRAILDKTKKSVADETDSIKSEIARLEAELKETESSLPEDFKAEYLRVSRVRGEEALAAVEDDCCTGCYQRVTPNMISRLMMDDVVICTTCHRILYFPEDRSVGK